MTRTRASAPGAPRVAIVGVRRLRQGLGEHFARWLVAAGAQVPAFIGRTPESIEEGRRLLLARGIDARGFRSLDELLTAEPVDALVIASPAETHREWLERALAARLHVLCEKPFVWGDDDPGGTAARLVLGFARSGLLLHEHCQWPWTLPAFFALHPDAAGDPVRSLDMEMSPGSCGEEMLIDVLSHPVSLMQALLAHEAAAAGAGAGDEAGPGGGSSPAGDVRFSTTASGVRRLEVIVDWTNRLDPARPPVRMRLGMTTTAAQPRHASYAVNGRRVERRIRLPGYEMSLADGGREVPLEDPMKLAVADFVRALVEQRLPVASRPGLATDARRRLEIAERMQAVAGIVAAFRRSSAG